MSYLKPLQNITVCLSANAHWDLKPPFWLLSFSGVTLADSSYCTPESCRDGFFPLLPSHGFSWCRLTSPAALLLLPCRGHLFWITVQKICLYLILLAIKNVMGAFRFDPIPVLPFLLPWLKGIRITRGFPGRWEKSASWGGLGAPGFHFRWAQTRWRLFFFHSLQNCRKNLPKSSLQLQFIVLTFCCLRARGWGCLHVELEFKAVQVWISL